MNGRRRRDGAADEELEPAVGLLGAVMLVVGGIIGAGVFVNPAVVARGLASPAAALAAWGVGGAFALLGAFIYAELASAMPATGGEYVYLREAFGPLVGFLFAWTTVLVVHAGGMAAVAIVFARYLDVLAGAPLPRPVVIVATLAGLAAINAVNVEAGAGLQTWAGLAKILALGFLICAGLIFAHPASLSADVPFSASSASDKDSLGAFAAALVPVIFSYGGWQTANYVAGEIRDSRRRLAIALIAGVLAVVAIYLLVNLACLRALGMGGLAATVTPASDVLARAVGPWGARLAAGMIALSAFGFLSQSMLTGPRVLYALARDGLFFRQVGRLGTASRTPTLAIVVVAGWTALLALTGAYDRILTYVTAMNVLFFGLTAAGLFVLRRPSRPADPARPGGFRTPGHPWTTLAFILACAAVVAAAVVSRPIDSAAGFAVLLLGVPAYLVWRRKPAGRAVAP